MARRKASVEKELQLQLSRIKGLCANQSEEIERLRRELESTRSRRDALWNENEALKVELKGLKANLATIECNLREEQIESSRREGEADGLEFALKKVIKGFARPREE